METVFLKVEGMSCGHCEIAVQDAARKLPGVKKAKANRRRKEALFDYDPVHVTPEQIIAVINNAGYHAASSISGKKTAGAGRGAYQSVSAIYDDYIKGEKFPFNCISKIIWGFKDTDYSPGLLEKIPDSFSGDLLDMPAGTGVLTLEKYALLKNARIVCMDYSKEMLKTAQKRFIDNNFKNISCVLGDACKIPFQDETFDTVLSMNGLHAFADKDNALAEIYRVLKKGGLFAGCFYVKGITRRTDWFVRHFFVKNGTFTPPFFTKSEIIEKLQKDYTSLEFWNTGSIMCVTGKKPEQPIPE